MEAVAVRGAGVVGLFGAGMDSLSGIISGCFPKVPQTPPAATDSLLQFTSRQSLRRTDHFCRLALTALFHCLDDAHLSPGACEKSALILATGYGPVESTCSFKDSLIDNGSLGASPTTFTKSVQNQAAAHIGMLLGLHGPVTTICQHHLPFHMALMTAGCLLQQDRVNRVLVGGVDEFSSFLDYCRRRYLTDSSSETVSNLSDAGVVPGEGAAFFVVEKMNGQRGEIVLEVEVREGLGTGNDVQADWSPLFGDFPTVSALDLAASYAQVKAAGGQVKVERSMNGQTARMALELRN